jgi:pimeloyl-ACP methyl ester carboxylesterase/DNA-binding CsgD family transcriptional regulator
MDAPPVRYAKTSDGYDIAYLVGGEGPPLVFMPFHFNQIQRRWRGPWYARGLAECRQVYLYDSRGQGFSSCGLRRDPTVDDYLRDLEAVIEANGLQRFALVAYGGFAHVAIRYTVEHPESVHALVLICTSESFAAWPLLSLVPLAETNWDLFVNLAFTKNAPQEIKARLVDFAKSSTTQEDHIRMIRGFAASDVGELLPRLTVPVLLLHSERQHWLSPEEGVKLAARIPGARLVFLEGDAEPDDVQVVRAARRFLEEVPPLLDGEAKNTGRTVPVLSSRQREVLDLLARGRTNREIAEALVLSERTVQRHIADLYARIGVRNRAEATAFALTQSRSQDPLGISAQPSLP